MCILHLICLKKKQNYITSFTFKCTVCNIYTLYANDASNRQTCTVTIYFAKNDKKSYETLPLTS